MFAGAPQPDLSTFGVPVLVRAARVQDLVGTHGSIADKDAFVIRPVGVEYLPGRGLLAPAPVVVAPDAFVEAVVGSSSIRGA